MTKNESILSFFLGAWFWLVPLSNLIYKSTQKMRQTSVYPYSRCRHVVLVFSVSVITPQ